MSTIYSGNVDEIEVKYLELMTREIFCSKCVAFVKRFKCDPNLFDVLIQTTTNKDIVNIQFRIYETTRMLGCPYALLEERLQPAEVSNMLNEVFMEIRNANYNNENKVLRITSCE